MIAVERASANGRRRLGGLVRTVYPYRFFATSGGFISYGVDVPDLYREAASYIDRILKGAKPGDLLARRVCHRSNDRLYATTIERISKGTIR